MSAIKMRVCTRAVLSVVYRVSKYAKIYWNFVWKFNEEKE